MKSQCCDCEAPFITAAINGFAFESSKTRCLHRAMLKRVVVSNAPCGADE